MNRVKILTISLLVMLAGLGGSAALHPGSRHSVAPPGTILLQAPISPQKSPAATPQKSPAKGAAQRLGEWLETHKALPLEQQEKALESDPKYKKLAPDRQAALKERLRKFNSLPPDQRDRALQRMNYISKLSPDQRQQLREANEKLQALPQDRRVMVHTELRHLRKMDAQQREEAMQSDNFRSTFSDQEQGILKQLSAIDPSQSNAPAGQAKQPAQPKP